MRAKEAEEKLAGKEEELAGKDEEYKTKLEEAYKKIEEIEKQSEVYAAEAREKKQEVSNLRNHLEQTQEKAEEINNKRREKKRLCKEAMREQERLQAKGLISKQEKSRLRQERNSLRVDLGEAKKHLLSLQEKSAVLCNQLLVAEREKAEAEMKQKESEARANFSTNEIDGLRQKIKDFDQIDRSKIERMKEDIMKKERRLYNKKLDDIEKEYEHKLAAATKEHSKNIKCQDDGKSSVTLASECGDSEKTVKIAAAKEPVVVPLKDLSDYDIGNSKRKCNRDTCSVISDF